MNYLTVEDVSKQYGEKTLFEKITFYITKGDKTALIARNGSGKSTLLRLIAGLEQPDGQAGRIDVHPKIKVGFLDQSPDYAPDMTILDAVLSGDDPVMIAIRNYEAASLNPDDTETFQKALDAMETTKAWDAEVRLKEMLGKLHLHDLTQLMGTLSGGQQKRVALAAVLAMEPDFLILDEPTNHLDIDMVEWLEEYLLHPGISILMVTHDRYFLDRVCNTILELDEGVMHRYSGNYSEYLEAKELRETIEAKTLDKNRKLLKTELEWMRRMPKARGTKAKSRIGSFYKLREETLKTRNNDELKIEIQEQRLGSKIIELHNISKKYGDKLILNPFSYKFNKGERVGIVGPNGAGKSTFLRLITGQEKSDTGKVVIGDTIQFGHYKQEGLNLPQDKKMIEVIRDVAEYIPLTKGRKLSAVQLLERFMFPRSKHFVYVSQLSGGEQRRLYLLKVLMSNPNFLILDEPTNDLDILTLNALEDFLADYRGCLIVVSHDRFMLDKVVDHLFVLDGKGGVKDVLGSYSEFRDKRAELQAADKPKKEAKAEYIPPRKQNAPQLSKEQKKELRKLERLVEKLEVEKENLLAQLSAGDLSGDEINNVSKQLGDVQNKLDEAELQWMELADQA